MVRHNPTAEYNLARVLWQNERRDRTNYSEIPNSSPTAAEHTVGANEMVAHVTGAGEMVASASAIRADVELARLALGLKLSPAFRLWAILHDMSREGRQGFTLSELFTRCGQLGVKGCRRYARRVIYAGVGLFWNYDPATDKVYPAGYVTLSQRLTERAAIFGLPNLYETNTVGRLRDMYIPVIGTSTDFEAAVLSSWYAAHNNPTISRHTLSLLFNRSAAVIRLLEKRAGVDPVTNTVETTNLDTVPRGVDGELRRDVKWETNRRGITTYTYRIPNTYHAGTIRQHNRRGQGRRAASIVYQLIQSDRLAGLCAAGRNPARLNRTGRIYCNDHKAVKNCRKRGNTNILLIPYKPGEGSAVVWRDIST
jgi:hypothetical protein